MTAPTDETQPEYRRELPKSPHHATWGLITLGSTCLLGPNYFPLSLIVGAAAYVLGWIYFPDMPLFRRWVDRRHEAKRLARSEAELAEFVRQRDAALSALSISRRQRYQALTEVCRDIEQAGTNTLTPNDPAADPRLRKLDELMWTHLRMLIIEESLERFLETERRDNLPGILQEAEGELADLTTQIEAAKRDAHARAAVDAKERLRFSRLETLEVLRKRVQRVEQAQANLALVRSEQDRLDQQVKLIRADAVATRNTETFTARIDATVEHLEQTNRWLSEMDEFRDLVGNLPVTPQRVGYQSNSSEPGTEKTTHRPPPLPLAGKRRS